MTVLLEIKEKVKGIYAEYSYIILMILKFLLAITTCLAINRTIGFLEPLNNIFLVIILALLCSLFSVKTASILAGLLIVGHSYALGIEVFGITIVLFLLLFLFFLRFDETDGLALILTPLAISIGIPAVVPICFGLKKRPSSGVAVASGTVVYYYLGLLNEKASILQNADDTEKFEKMLVNLRILTDGLLKNRQMFLIMIALVLVLCIVYVIRRISIDYAWQIAIGTGSVVYLLTMLAGGLFWDIDVSALQVVLGTIGAGAAALIMEFAVLNVDYSRSERMEFEDDEYYYYVKAIPKIKIGKQQVEVKTIDSDQNNQETELDESGKE